jgi:hypothetical protein
MRDATGAESRVQEDVGVSCSGLLLDDDVSLFDIFAGSELKLAV